MNDDNIIIKIAKFVSGTDSRPTYQNWPNALQRIIDTYEDERGIVHGVQKDAIQNGWDARVNRKSGKKWKFVFELIETPKLTLFTFTDQGTTGLTGKILSPEDLMSELPEYEKWGRFENLAFRKTDSEIIMTLGARGQGKFIFVGASRNNSIIYESLRNDMTYRMGARNLQTIDSRTNSLDGDAGRTQITEFTNGLIEPLTHVGTRVVIVNPIPELIKAIKNGEFIEDINETWWEIIRNFNAEIILKYDGKEIKANVPEEFLLPDTDTESHLVNIIKNSVVKRGKGSYNIKRFHIVCNLETSVPEHLRGIAIQRGGMKICSIEPDYFIREHKESVYGYISFEKETEYELQQYESPEHYSFFWRKAFAGHLKTFIKSKLITFSREKLGYAIDVRARQRERERNAERKAITAINEYAQKIGLLGFGSGGGGGGGGGSGIAAKKIRVYMKPLEFPRKGDLRINYGESFTDLYCYIINDSDSSVDLRFKAFLRVGTDVKRIYQECDIKAPAKTRVLVVGPFEQIFTENEFPKKGEYIFVSRIHSLQDYDKGTLLDTKKRIFYLEEDPPNKGLIEGTEPMQYPDDINHLMGEIIEGSRGGYILRYNTTHNEYMMMADIEDDLASYLFRILSLELCRIDLEREESSLFRDIDIEDPISIVKKSLEIFGELSAYYYG